MKTTLLVTKKLLKKFGNKIVLKDIDITIEAGKVTAILGANGSGKSTFVGIIAGLIKESSGKVVLPSKTKKNETSYVHQNYRMNLLPWKSNLDNLALAQQIAHKIPSKFAAEKLVRQSSFGINLKKFPYQLSGGQQQLLAILKALVTQPKLIFFDEPSANLDLNNRLKFGNFLQNYFLLKKPTIIMITQNIEEATLLASKILIFSSDKKIISIKNQLPYPRKITTCGYSRAYSKIYSTFEKATK